MSLTPSEMVALGTAAPDFNLPDTLSGKSKRLNELKGEKATLIMFICNHCPFVLHINEEISRMGKELQSADFKMIAISSNNVETHPQDGPTYMTEVAQQEGYSFPYLYDETQEVAKAYNAACTPDFFLYDASMQLQYRGQLDDSRPQSGTAADGKDLREAIAAVLAGAEPVSPQIASIGCNIKWK